MATLLSMASAQAEPPEPHVNNTEVTPFVGFMAGGRFEDPVDSSDRDVKEDTNFGVILDLNADGPERQYELLYSQESTQVEGAVPLNLDVQYLQIGGIVNFMDNPRVVPFFGITVGAARFSPDANGMDSETKIAFSIGGGLKIPITDHVGIRLDGRAFITLLDTDGNIFCVSSSTVSGCRIRAQSDTFIQYAAMLGITAGF
jgi:opacity protein-like surface antigen